MAISGHIASGHVLIKDKLLPMVPSLMSLHTYIKWVCTFRHPQPCISHLNHGLEPHPRCEIALDWVPHSWVRMLTYKII